MDSPSARYSSQLFGTPCASADYKPRTAKVESSFQAMPSHALCTALCQAAVAIRPLEHADLPAVRLMFAAGMRAYADQFNSDSKLHKFWHRYVDGALLDDLSDQGINETYIDTGGFWVAVDSATGRLLGCVGAQRISEQLCELRRMSVNQQARGRGIGQLLVWWLEEWAVAEQFGQVFLTTGSVMVPAKALYLAAGYELYEVRTVGPPQKATRPDGMTELFDFQQLAFRKSLTSNSGRWVWAAHSPHSSKL